MTTTAPVYLAFQGGGARGVSHVGGLAAVEELGLHIDGVAGTSAGALVAALVAAGYSSRDILDAQNRSHILQRIADGKFKDPTQLFTANGWRAIVSLRIWTRRWSKVHSLWSTCSEAWRPLLVSAAIAIPIVLGYFAPGPLLVAIALVAIAARGIFVKIHSGLAPLTDIREAVDQALASALGIPAGNITFAQLQASGKRPLKLIATNVSDQSLALFCYETTPDTPVADAVAASICLPFIFKLWTFQSTVNGVTAMRSYLDGGLMSNLPIWPFDEERALNPHAITIAFGLRPSPRAGERSAHWLPAAVNTVVAGPPEIHFRGVEKLVHVPLESVLDLLDFDAGFAAFSTNIQLAKDMALQQLKHEITEVPVYMRALLDRMREHIRDKPFGFLGIPAPGVCRVALAIQRPTQKLSFSIAYETGHFAPPNSFHLALASIPGSAWHRRFEEEPIMEIFQDESPSFGKVYPDSRWMALVPIQAPADEDGIDPALAVVAIIDSPEPIDSNAMQNARKLNDLAIEIRRFALDFSTQNDLGTSARRAFSWL